MNSLNTSSNAFKKEIDISDLSPEQLQSLLYHIYTHTPYAAFYNSHDWKSSGQSRPTLTADTINQIVSGNKVDYMDGKLCRFYIINGIINTSGYDRDIGDGALWVLVQQFRLTL